MTTKTATNIKVVIITLMITFFTMGFVDSVGIATNYVKQDFGLSDTLANLMPSMVFLWFLFLAIPSGLLMNKIGRKNTTLLSLIVTLPALVLPLVSYSIISMTISFALLGIGNALMQVSLNPLLANIVDPNKMASTLTFGQFVKAIASFIAPIIAAWAAASMGDWRGVIYPLFAIITAVVIVMLYFTKIDEGEKSGKSSSFKECFALLGNPVILIMFIGIMAHVGLDVGINVTAPRILTEQLGLSLDEASFSTSWYFIFRTTGCLLGSYVLNKFTSRSVFVVSILMILAGVLLLFTSSETLIYTGIALFGLGNSNIFSVMFSQALKSEPSYNNEISGLMITGVCGGAIIPPIMGVMSDGMGSQVGAIIVLLVCVAYLLGFVAKKIQA